VHNNTFNAGAAYVNHAENVNFTGFAPAQAEDLKDLKETTEDNSKLMEKVSNQLNQVLAVGKSVEQKQDRTHQTLQEVVPDINSIKKNTTPRGKADGKASFPTTPDPAHNFPSRK
jgi:phage-related minor tail protein